MRFSSYSIIYEDELSFSRNIDIFMFHSKILVVHNTLYCWCIYSTVASLCLSVECENVGGYSCLAEMYF